MINVKNILKVNTSYLKLRFNKSFTTNNLKKRSIDPYGGSQIVNTHPPANPLRLNNKFAFITGGCNGVGLETAKLFVESGVSGVSIIDLDPVKGKESESYLNTLNKDNKEVCKFIQADVSNNDQIERAFIDHMQRFGKLNVLFNNAGILINDDDGPCNTSLDTYNKTMNVNVLGVFLCHKYGIPEMLKSNGGSIINVASIVALTGSAAAQVVYTASKGAVLAMSREIAIMYSKDNIRVNTISPGPLSTSLLKSFLNTDEKLDRRLIHNPLGRFGDPKEIAQYVTFLASDESSLFNASNVAIDGGITNAYVTAEKI